MEEKSLIIRKKIFENLIIAIAMMLYFILINFSYIRMQEDFIIKGIKYVSLLVLFFSISIIEIAYSKDNGLIAINGIEILLLAICTLTASHFSQIIKLSFQKYILILAFIFITYYLLKSIIIYTNETKKYLNSLSDIHEILTKEPIKKETKKRED